MKRFAFVLGIIYISAILLSVAYANFFGKNIVVSADKGDVKRLERLIEKENNKEVLTDAMVAAIFADQAECVKLLIEKVDNPDMSSEKYGNCTPLWLAAMSGKKDIAELLIDKGADINIVGSNGDSLFIELIRSGRFDTAKLILDKGAEFDAEKFNSSKKDGLHIGLHIIDIIPEFKDELDYISRYMLDKGVDINSKFGEHVVRAAILLKDYELLDFLIENGGDIHLSAGLSHAAQHGEKEIMDYLIAKGADIQSDYGAMALESFYGNADLMQHMIEKGVPMESDRINFIVDKAIRDENEEIARLLLEKGAKVNKVLTEEKGKTVLFTAVNKCSPEMVRLLLNYGASVKIKDINDYNVFDALNSLRNNIDWFDFGHKKDCDRIEEMLKSAD